MLIFDRLDRAAIILCRNHAGQLPLDQSVVLRKIALSHLPGDEQGQHDEQGDDERLETERS